MTTPMEIIPDKRRVVGLVEQGLEGKICLPNFQRDFVWTEIKGEFYGLADQRDRGYDLIGHGAALSLVLGRLVLRWSYLAS